MRRVDALGIAGALMLLAGAGTFLGSYGFLPLWVAWLFGPLLWYLGFALEISWIGLRVFGPQPEPTAEKEKQHRTIRVFRSNFLEHDYEVPTERTMRKLPVFSAFLILILVSGLTLSVHAADNPAALFAAKCAMCHGPDGAGKTVMGAKLNIKDLAAPDVQKQSDAELAQVIAKGKNKMPAFDTKLSKDEIKQLTGYLRELSKKR
jgi:cytochrome c6